MSHIPKHIFISYARADGEDFAFKLHDQLEAEGYPTWLDKRDIPPGENWDKAIEQGIRTAWALLFVMTENSILSEVCQDEWMLAINLKLPVIPLKIQPIADTAMPLRLHRRQYVDFTGNFEHSLAALRDRLRGLNSEEAKADVVAVLKEDKAEEISSRGGTTAALFLTQPSDVPRLPRALIGRDDVKGRVIQLLNQGQVTLLHGMSGSGKTAIAATVAADWIRAGRAGVLWMSVGSLDSTTIFESLAHPFGAQGLIASAADSDQKIIAMQEILKRSGTTLVVLDDVWNGPALNTVLKAIPQGLPVLVTSRQRFQVGEIVDIPNLAPPKALELLRFHAADMAADSEAAAQLCAKLGYLAFAIEIAGRAMAGNGWTAAELLRKINEEDFDLQVPLEFREAGRESVAKLLEASINALDQNTQTVFFVLGAFFTPRVTPMMMMLYFNGTPEVTEAHIALAREKLGPDVTISDEELIPVLRRILLQMTDPAPAQRALEDLQTHGLVEYVPPTEESVGYFRVHDLAYAYAAERNSEEHHRRALTACINYTDIYNEPNLENFAALQAEVENFVGASIWAMEDGRYEDVEQFAWNLYAQGSQFLNYRGYYKLAIDFLRRAADAAIARDAKRDVGAHYTHLGSCLRNLGQYDQAIDYFQQALAIDRELGNKRDEGTDLGNLGNAYNDLRQYDKAIECYQKVLEIATELQDEKMQGSALGNLGSAYNDMREYQKAIGYFEQALVIRRKVNDKRGEGNDLGNLGISYKNLGEFEKSVQYHLQALAISKGIGDRRGEASDYNNLGVTHSAMGRIDEAIAYFEQSRAIYMQLGLAHMVREVERNMSIARNRPRETPQAQSGRDEQTGVVEWA